MKKYFFFTTMLVFLYLFMFPTPVGAVPLVDLPSEVKTILSEDMLMAIDRPYALVNGNYVPLAANNPKVKPYLYKFSDSDNVAYMVPLEAVAKYAGAAYQQTSDEIIINNKIHLKIKDNKVIRIEGTDFIFERDYFYMQFKDGEFYVDRGMLGMLFSSDGFSYDFQIARQTSFNNLIHISRDSRFNLSLYLQDHDFELSEYMNSLQTKEKFSNTIVIQQNGSYARAYDKDVRLDNNNLAVKPITRRSRMLVPAKFFAENFGAKIEWDGPTRTALITTDTKQIKITANKAYMVVNGKQIALEVPAELFEGRMYIPLRAITDVFGQNIYYTNGIAVLSPTSISPETLSSEEISIFGRYFNARKDNDQDELYGNSQNNSNNVKHVVKRGEWTYYIDFGYNAHYNFNGLWKIKDDGKTRQKLVNGQVDYMDVVGDWVYYYNDKGAYKVRTDGSSFTKLSVKDYDIQQFYIRNGLIYYFDWSSNNFYSYSLDDIAVAGSQIEVHAHTNEETMIGKYVYYTNRDDGDTLYQINVETGINTKITNGKVGGFAVMDNYVYYNRGYNEPGIYRLYLNDKRDVLINEPREPLVYIMQDITEEKISGDKADSINAYKGWIYYFNPNDGDKLYKMRADGTAKTRLNSQASYNINIIGNWIYYRSDGKLFKIKTDGTGKSRLNPDTLGLDPYVIGPPIDVPPVSSKTVTLEQKNNDNCLILKPVENSRHPDVAIGLEHEKTDKSIRFGIRNLRDPKVLVNITFILGNGVRKEFTLKNPDKDGFSSGIYNYSKDVFTGEKIQVEVSWTAYGEKGKASTTFRSVM